MAERLLVVEDSRAMAKVIEQLGKSLGYEVTIAASLAEVEAILQGEGGGDFFVATVDYSLPDAHDGEAIKCVLSHGIPSIVLTGHMDDVTRQKILAQPVVDYIPKENSQAFLYLKRVLHWQLTNKNNGILVVDDSLATRNHIVELLKRRNFSVYVANDGEKALEVLAERNNIKVVITDLEMPVMDGIELTNEIRKRYSRDKVSVIGISGATSGIHSARFIKNGADDFLRKPFCPEEFYCRVTQSIENLANIAQIQRAANTDYLTELPNRRAFIQFSEKKIASNIDDQVQYCLAMVDIDYFKQVNDNYGHEAGDNFLKLVALYMRKHLGGAMLARLGGEEFAVLMSGVDEDQLYSRLDDLRREISIAQMPYEGQQVATTVSIGVVFNGEKSLAAQMNQADQALYNAKENGRNQIAIAE